MWSSASRLALGLVLVAASTSASACGAGTRGNGSALTTTSTAVATRTDFTAAGVDLDRFTLRVRRFMKGFAGCSEGSNMTATSACLTGAVPASEAEKDVIERLNKLIPKTQRACAVALLTLGETAIRLGFMSEQVIRAWRPGNAFGVRSVLARLAASISPYFRALKRASTQCGYTF